MQLLFFVSSRRRHTRWPRDWSSDVCSSDLASPPADHHSLALLCGPAAKLLHVSFETLDLESVGQGHQYLRAAGWNHYWGIGRHILGSQVFDYWKDPAGDEWEHYADGDVMNADYPT